MTTPTRVGVIGSGLAGLTAAYELANARRKSEDATSPDNGPLFDVQLFERSSKLGMDSASIQVPLVDELGERTTFHLDTPMRAVQGGYYTHVLDLYRRLGIRLHTAAFNYSFFAPSSVLSQASSKSDPAPSREATFIYEGGNGLRLKPLGIPAQFNSSLSLASIQATFRYLFTCLLITLAYLELVLLAGCSYHARTSRTLRPSRRSRISDAARYAVGLVGRRLFGFGTEEAAKETLGGWCRRWRISKRMREDVLEPLFCCVCTCSRAEVLEYPAEEILDYIWLTFGEEHFVCADGVHAVVEALSAPLLPTNVHLGSAGSIRRLSRTPNGSAWMIETQEGTLHIVDRIVCATQANQAKTLFDGLLGSSGLDKVDQERAEALGLFEYCSTLVVNHFDDNVLPSQPSDLRDLNIALAPALSTSTTTSKADPPVDFAVSRAPSTPERVDSPPPSYSPSIDRPSIMTPAHIMATHVISRTHPPTLHCEGHRGRKLLQTTNPTVGVDPDQIVSETWFERVKVTQKSKAALDGFLLRHGVDGGRFQGIGGVWFCGSWCAEGIPLLEGCVRSAERVAQALIAETLPPEKR